MDMLAGLTVGQSVLLAVSASATPRRATVVEVDADSVRLRSVEPLPSGWRERPVLHLTYVAANAVQGAEVSVRAFDPTSVVVGAPPAGAATHRRSFARVAASLPVQCLLASGTVELEEVDARLHDVSGGGVALLTAADVRKGARLVLSIGVPEGSVLAVATVLAVGRVHDNGERTVRAEFTLVHEDDRLRLLRHILDLLADS